jgi:hypothetical protein
MHGAELGGPLLYACVQFGGCFTIRERQGVVQCVGQNVRNADTTGAVAAREVYRPEPSHSRLSTFLDRQQPDRRPDASIWSRRRCVDAPRC